MADWRSDELGIGRLLRISTPVSTVAATKDELSRLDSLGSLGQEIAEVIQLTNGFYALETALHFFPASSSGEHTVFGWNEEGLWRSAFGEKTRGLFFFAENVFGEQFCVRE